MQIFEKILIRCLIVFTSVIEHTVQYNERSLSIPLSVGRVMLPEYDNVECVRVMLPEYEDDVECWKSDVT